MKVLNKVRIYFIAVILCLLLFLVEAGKWRYGLGAALFALAAAGWAYAAYFLKALEKGLELLPERQKFQEWFRQCKEPLLQKIVDKEQELFLEMEKSYSSEVEDKQSQINSLQSQINPHFLYNTLECIRSEAILQGCASIANMAKLLASFFRYSISRAENIVTIADELNNIQNYIMIQNYRFEDKFLFQIEMEEEDKRALSCLIPKMTIQPIVENAIFHGLEAKMEDCRVKIIVRMTEDMVILTVSDNGIGMDEEQLAKLRFRMEHGEEKEKAGESDKDKRLPKGNRGNGIALYNINQRLKLSFGPACGLHAYSIEGEGTDVEITMPIRTEKEQE